MNENNLKRALTELMYKEADELMLENVPYEFSAEFEKRMSKLIKRRRKPYFRMINTVGKRAACIALAIFIASATTVMSVEALRNAVFNFFISIFSTHSDITAVDDDRHPDTIEDIYEITYDISDYNIDFESNTDRRRIISYMKNDNEILFEQFVNDAFNMRANTEGTVISHIIINGYDIMYYYDNHNHHTFVWDNGQYTLFLSTNLNKKEAMDIVSSIKKVENKKY